MSFPARPHAGDGGIPLRRGLLCWARRLFWPPWHEELLALGLIIMTVAAGWLLARH